MITRERLRLDALIGGEPVAARETFEDVDPATGETLAEVARGGPEEIDRAVAAAREVFEKDWSRRSPAERANSAPRSAAARDSVYCPLIP